MAQAKSSRHGYFAEYLIDDFGGLNAFDFRFGTKHQAVFEHGASHNTHIVGSHEIAAVESGPGTACEHKRLRRSGTCAQQYAFVCSGRPDNVDYILNQLGASDYSFDAGAQGLELARKDRLDIAAFKTGLGRLCPEHPVC